MSKLLILVLLGLSLSACGGFTQPISVRDLPQRELPPAEDPIQRLQSESTVDGLVLALSIDGPSVELESATLARIPRPLRRSDVAGEDLVTVAGFAGGALVSEQSAPDTVVNAAEGTGLVRLTKRHVIVLLAAPRALDTIEVNAPATGARGQLSVRVAYDNFCPAFNPDNPYCPQPSSAL